MSYAALHREVEAEFVQAGTSCTFVHATPGTYDEATGTYSTPLADTVAGRAVAVSGSGERYRQLVLVREEVVTLLFWPSEFGETPQPGWSVTWGSGAYTVDVVEPVAPTGDVIVTRVLVSR